MIVPRSVAFDEGPNPQPMDWPAYYVVGPRTTPAMAAAIRAGGTRLVCKIQPCRWKRPDGTDETAWRWDTDLRIIPTMTDAAGGIVTLAQPGQGMEGSCVLDFGNSFTPGAMAQLVERLCTSLGAVGVMIDYGSLSLEGLVLIEPANWQRWIDGYMRYRTSLLARKLRVWNCSNRQATPGASLCMEGIVAGGSDDGWPPSPLQALRRAEESPGSILLVQSPGDVLRKEIVAAALLSDACVDYRPQFFTGDRVSREPAPELMKPDSWTMLRLAEVL